MQAHTIYCNSRHKCLGPMKLTLLDCIVKFSGKR